MGWRLRKSDSLGKLRQRERFSFRNSKYSAGDQFECFSNGRLDLLLRCGREPAREEEPLPGPGLVDGSAHAACVWLRYLRHPIPISSYGLDQVGPSAPTRSEGVHFI